MDDNDNNENDNHPSHIIVRVRMKFRRGQEVKRKKILANAKIIYEETKFPKKDAKLIKKNENADLV